MRPTAVFEQDALATELKIWVPESSPALFHDRHRLLVLEAEAVMIQHACNLNLAPAAKPAFASFRIRGS